MHDAAAITPFWNRIPAFFLYGINRNTLILIAALATAIYFVSGWLTLLVYNVIIIKYASVVLQHTTQGHLTPPELSFNIINESLELPFKLFIVYLCYFYALAYILGTLPMLLSIPLLITAILLLPAVVISLVITEEIGHALNPLNWFSIAQRIGWPYLIMFLFLLLFGLVKSEFSLILGNRLPISIIPSFWLAVEAYFMFVMFHLMGYIVLQYHEALGIEAPEVIEDDSATDDQHATPLMRRFIDEGNIDAALAELSSLIQASPQNLELRRRMYVLLSTHGETERLKRFAPHYFSMLMQQQNHEEATSVYMESAERGDTSFVPDSPGHYLPVMKILRRRRQCKQAVLLAQGFHQRFPSDVHTPEVYLEMAKILCEELQRDDLAKNILLYLMKNHPSDILISEVKSYLGVVSNLQAPAPAG